MRLHLMLGQGTTTIAAELRREKSELLAAGSTLIDPLHMALGALP
jgi:hypothetical protein